MFLYIDIYAVFGSKQIANVMVAIYKCNIKWRILFLFQKFSFLTFQWMSLGWEIFCLFMFFERGRNCLQRRHSLYRKKASQCTDIFKYLEYRQKMVMGTAYLNIKPKYHCLTHSSMILRTHQQIEITFGTQLNLWIYRCSLRKVEKQVSWVRDTNT